jgi:hypothetical protein
VTGRSLRVLALAALLMGAVGWGLLVFGLLGDALADDASRPLASVGAFYVLTLISFAAFPGSRRNDLSVALIAAGLLTALARQAADGHRHLYEAAWAVIGVAAVHAPSHLEALRKSMREAPAAPAFRSRAKERRAGARTPLELPVPLFAAWGLGLAIVVFTLGPQSWRPHLAGAQTERFAAYFLTALAFAIAYPKRRRMIALAAVAAALILELAQYAAPGRDPGLPDAIAKAIGGLAGVSLAGVLSLTGKRGMLPRLPTPKRAV